MFQYQGYYGQPDYLIKIEKSIVDAKYKTYYKERYREMVQWKKDQLATDVRQLSGYARDLKIRKFLGINDDAHPHLVIIYPNQEVSNKIEKEDLSSQVDPIVEFHKTHKLAIDLPTI